MSSFDSDNTGMRLPEDDLPPVQPPSTGFFVQLFLLPAVIVFGLVTVWFLFGKITDSQGSPEEFLVRMEQGAGDRWKAAHDLSRLLTPNSEYVKDPQLAYKVSQALENALLEKNPNEQHIQYLEYLAGALGRFQLNVGVPALRKATAKNLPTQLRWVALHALANIADQVKDVDDPNLVLELQALCKDDNTTIRELAAVTLGILGDPSAAPTLIKALDDKEPTVRYNAARALAKLGDPAGLPVFEQMLRPDDLRKQFVVQDKFGNSHVDENRVEVVLYEGLRGLADLHKKSKDVDLSSVRPAVELLLNHPNPRIVAEAREIVLKLERGTSQ